MNFVLITIKNLKKNINFYFLYLVSISFVITLLFSFTSFSMNEVMLEKISADGRVETMCNTVSIFLMAFVIFYMNYSNRFFLRRRTKELGIYTLIGYRKSLILSLLTIENLLIYSTAFLLGLIWGAILHKGIVLGISSLLQLSIDYSSIPFFEMKAILRTGCFIILVVIVLVVSNAHFLLQTSLMKLIRFERSAEKKLNFRKFPAFLGLIMTLSGYLITLNILQGKDSLWLKIGFSPMGLLTLLLVVSGTILFIASFLP